MDTLLEVKNRQAETQDQSIVDTFLEVAEPSRIFSARQGVSGVIVLDYTDPLTLICTQLHMPVCFPQKESLENRIDAPCDRKLKFIGCQDRTRRLKVIKIMISLGIESKKVRQKRKRDATAKKKQKQQSISNAKVTAYMQSNSSSSSSSSSSSLLSLSSSSSSSSSSQPPRKKSRHG